MSGEHSHAPHPHTHALEEHDHPLEAHSHPLQSPFITVAASDSDRRLAATYACDGTDDQREIQTALDNHEAVTLLAGTYQFSDTLHVNQDNALLQGQGRATVIKPSTTFPADHFLISLYRDETRPVGWATLRDFHLDGGTGRGGWGGPSFCHGLQFCCHRGRLDNLTIYGFSGDGLKVENAPGSGILPKQWDGFESKFSHLNIGHNGRYGINMRSTDQHWSDLCVHGSGEANVYGGFGGAMLSNCHFYAAPQSATGKQTIDNLVLSSVSRTRFVNCKIEHARRYLLHLKGDPKGGSLSFANTGFRNGSSEGPGLHPQIRIDRSGGNTWEVGLHGCWFDADSTQPSRNIEIVGNSLWGSRIEGCSFKHYSLEPVTPFGPLRGALSTVNGLGWNATDPNVAGDWLGHGEPGLEVIAGDTGQVWKCVTAPGTWVMV